MPNSSMVCCYKSCYAHQSVHILLSRIKELTDFPGGPVDRKPPCRSVVKNPPANARDSSSIPGWGRPPGGRNGNPFEYSCWEKSHGQRAWWATVHGLGKSQRLLSTHSQCRGYSFPWSGKISHAAEHLCPCTTTTTEPAPLSPQAATTEAREPRALASQEKPPQ